MRCKDLFTKIEKSEKSEKSEDLKLLKDPNDLIDFIKTVFDKLVEYFKNLVN